jgi:hypothetical protein
MRAKDVKIGLRVKNVRDGDWRGISGTIVSVQSRSPDAIEVEYDRVPLGWGTNRRRRSPIKSVEPIESPKERNQRLLKRREK